MRALLATVLLALAGLSAGCSNSATTTAEEKPLGPHRVPSKASGSRLPQS